MLPAKFQLFSKTDAKSNAMTTSRQRNKDTNDFSSSEDEDEDTPECDDDFEVLEIAELSKPAEIRHRTFLEIYGVTMHVRCEVLHDTELTQSKEWINSVSSDEKLDTLEMEFCAVYTLAESDKWSDVLRVFSENVLQEKLVGIILINYHDNLTLADDFFGDGNVQGMFVCVISHSHQHMMKSHMDESSSGIRVRVVNREDLPEKPGSGSSVDVHAVDKMMDTYFVRADQYGLDVGLYGHIFSYFDQVSKEAKCYKSKNEGLKVIKRRLNKHGFQIAHLNLYCVLVYKMNREGAFWNKKYAKLVKSCTKRFFKALIEVLRNKPEEIVHVVEAQLQFGNPVVYNGESESPFLHLLGYACLEVAAKLKSFEVQAVGLEIMLTTLHIKFMMESGNNVDELNSLWTDLLSQQPKLDHMKLLADESLLIIHALKLGGMLLPVQLQFNGCHAGQLIVSAYDVLSLGTLKIVLERFDCLLRSDGDFLTDFLVTCQELQSKRWKPDSDGKEYSFSVPDEGHSFIVTVIKQLIASGATNDRFIKPLHCWLTEILNEIVTENASATVNMILDVDRHVGRNEKVKKVMADTFKGIVWNKIRDMSLPCFTVYLQSVKDDRFPQMLVRIYLSSYFKQQKEEDSMLSKKPFKDFLTAYYSRWNQKIPTDDQARFVDFIFEANATYQDKQLEFIEDVLALDNLPIVAGSSPKVKEVHDTFTARLIVLIGKYNLQMDVCKILNEVMKKKPKHFTKVQELVYGLFVEEVCKGIPQHSKFLMENPTPDMSCVSTAAGMLYEYYKENRHMWSSPPPTPYNWYWKMITKLCDTLKPSDQNLDWCANSRGLIAVAALVHGVCPQGENQHEQEEIPPLQYHYFQWVAGLQRVMKHWKQCVEEGRCTANELQHYHQLLIDWDEDIQKQLCIQSLLLCRAFVNQRTFEFVQTSDRARNLLMIDGRYSLIGILASQHVLIPSSLQSGLDQVFANIQFLHEFSAKIEPRPQIREDVHLSGLIQLVNDLEKFLVPFVPFQKFVVHFSLHPNHFFQAFYAKANPGEIVTVTDARPGDGQVGINNDSPDCPRDIENTVPDEPMDEKDVIYMEIFCEMLYATMLSLKNLLTGNIPYEDLRDLNIVESLDKEEFKAQYQIVKEFEFESISESDVKDMGGIEDILYFQQFKDFLELLHDVLKLYGLTDCLSDPNIEEVLKVLSTLNSHTQMMKLTPVQAVENIANIERCLKLPKGSTGRQCVRLFSVVKESEKFSKFLKDRNFAGLTGGQLFHQNVQLLTVNLQNEEFQEDILNNLLIAYQFISPFLIPEIHLQDFLQQVYQVCKIDQDSATDDFCQLTNVNRNIDLLYLWFTRTEGNPLEELECILKEGHFNFVLHCSQQPDGYSPYVIGHIREQKNEVLLMFPANTFVDGQPMPDVIWKKEQIDDFIRQLGLLEKDKETEVQRFLDLYEIAKKMLNHQWQLRNLGYQMKMDPLNCNCSLDEAVDKEQSLWGILQKCQKKLSKLDEGCPNLLLLNTPKVLRIHSVLCEVSKTEEMMDRLTKEIGIAHDLLGDVKNLIDNTFRHIQDYCPDEEVFHTTLRNLIRTCLPSPESVSLASTGGSCTLHLAIDCSPRLMFGIILDIHGQHPKAYQILRCRTSTTSEEIEHFLKRVQAFPSLSFTLLAVNILPARLQELLVQLHNQVVHMSGHGQLHYIATGSSILQDLPKITVIDHTSNRMDLDKCEKLFAQVFTIHSVTLVHGKEGDGKSHYIRKRMREAKKSDSVVITINESFSPLVAITKLNELSLMCNNVIHFNITWLPPLNLKTDCSDPLHQVYMHGTDTISYRNNILNEVEWFFFDLFYLCYLEDYESGLSFTLPSDLKWSFYIEIPVHLSNEMDCFKEFCERYPLLKIIGAEKHICSDMPFDIDDDVQLVCKYLRAYKLRHDPVNGIDRVLPPTVHKKKDMKEGHHKRISFASGTLEEDECHELLQEYMKEHVKHTKMQQKLFIGHMKRRCQFMERFPAFNYNTGRTPNIGSLLMKTMLDEVNEFCHIGGRKDWAKSTQIQLIYERSAEGDGVCHLFTVNENAMKKELEPYKEKLKMTPPHAQKIHTRECLDRYLAAALNIPLDPETQRIKAIDDNAYVLTLDFFLKMLQIHERMESGIPVIIEGETGVGKTALLEMLSILWNTSLLEEHRKFLDRFGDAIQRIYDDSDDGISEELVKSLVNVMEGTKERKKEILFEDTLLICQSSLASRLQGEIDLRSAIATYLKRNVLQYTISLLDFESSWKEMQSRFTNRCLGDLSFIQFWQTCILECDSPDSESLSIFVFCLLRAKPAQTFYKLSIHSALTPADIGKFFKPVIELANRLMEAWKLVAWRENQQYVPKVTVFLDEVNTSSCPGLLKEIIVDRTLHGTPICENVFIVAACNPHQGNSVIFQRDRKYMSKVWTLGMYNVHPLHPTMHYLKWDYGALNKEQEELYVKEKMKMISREVESDSLNQFSLSYLSGLITDSQKIMRELAEEHMKNVHGCPQSDARILSHSCVSQRDIQRVFVFLKWLIKCYQSKSFEGRFEKNVELTQKLKTAVLVSLALVYYMRLDEHCNFGSQPSSYRSKYVARLKKETGESLKIDVALREELTFYCEKLHIPSGIAKTNALLENMFCIIACCCTRTPLIITGPPGSSKTLSFSLTLDRIKGRQSTLDPFKDFELFPSLDPLFYQGSKLTTCIEVETVFQRAIKRQRRFNEAGLPISCVVFMDEAGLPKESLEVLHKFLDNQEVSFVAITNHVLDAAKTNRAVSLFRSNYVQEDLYTLMKECLPNVPETAEKLCDTYYQLMKEDDNFQEFFGLRDFIHLGRYMRRKSQLEEDEIPQCLMQAIERNFNGYEYYDDVCQKFLSAIGSSTEKVARRSIIDVLKSSLSDKPTKDHLTDEANKVRYKLLIDGSEDESVRRLLFSFKIVDPSTTKTYMCSDFPEDSEVQKINTIAAIRHSIRKGYTIVMTQTASIHGSFYDVFNQYFKIIEDPAEGKTKFYANIAIGSDLKQCQVHEEFQCIVVIKLSDLLTTPGPFLNRFEKYSLSHRDFLEARLTDFPPNLKSILSAVKDKVEDFVNHFEHSSFYGVVPGETVNSLVLSILPQCDFEFDHSTKDSEMPCGWNLDILQYIIQVLQTEAGMRFTMVAFPKEMVWKINPSDEKGEAFFSDTTHKSISSAMKYLLSPKPDHEQITKESQFVVSVISQWLVVYLCSKLLNLMTAEGFILSQVKMLPWCMDTYLFDQSHFSLKDTITSYFRELQHCCEKSTIKLESVCNKVVCFTHSTPAIHGLPEFTSTDSINDSIVVEVKRIIYDDVARVYLCKLSSITSEKGLRNHLQKFFSNAKKDIMVMVIGMQETSIQIVNHVRIIVEETETSVTERKLFIFLLHFPSSLYHKPCYPAIFATGWDHCYLDTVLPQTLDIRQWFKAAYKGGSDQPQLFQEDLMDNFRKDAVEVLRSRVLIGSPNGGGFNSICDNEERLKRFKELLDGPIGDKLATLYMRCWEQPELAFCLKEAAEHTRNNMTSLSISEVVHDHFRTTFYNFLSFMIHNINTNLNIDLFFDHDKDSHICKLFLQLMDLLPVPKIAEIKAYNNTFDSRQQEAFKPSFPFFWKVNSALDCLVEEVIKEYQEGRTLGSKPKRGRSTKTNKLTIQSDVLVESIVAKMSDHSTDMLGHVLTVLDQQPQLWEVYIKHFLCLKCHIRDFENPIAKSVITMQFGSMFAEKDMKKRLARLHYETFVEPCDLGIFSPSPLSPDPMLGSRTDETKAEDIIPSLFRVFLSDSFNDDCVELVDRVEKLQLWHSLFLEHIIHPSFKQLIFTKAIEPSHQSQLHVMTAVFHLMQAQQSNFGSDNDCKFLLAVQQSLIDQLSEKNDSIGLSRIMDSVLRFTEPQITTENDAENQRSVAINITRFLETILKYFINAQRPLDMPSLRWFLHDINKPNGVVARITHSTSKQQKSGDLRNIEVRLLGDMLSGSFEGSSMSQPLDVFNSDVRALVGQELHDSGATSSSYFPPVYREKLKCSIAIQFDDDHSNKDVMKVQPLADVYYLCLMEHWGRDHNMSLGKLDKLDNFMQQIKQAIALVEDTAEQILLHIELQAVLQVALNAFATELVSHFSKQTTKLPDLNLMQRIISDNAIECHKKMVMVFLLRHLRSPYALNEFLNSPTFEVMASVLPEPFPPIKPLLVHNMQPLHLFSFMDSKASDKLANAYKSVSRLMCEIAKDAKSSKAIKNELSHLLRNDDPIANSQGLEVDKKLFMKMSVWLVVYYDFFLKKKMSPLLVKAVRQQGYLSILDFTPEQMSVLECFLMQKLIKSETSQSKNVPPRDPLYELFTGKDLEHSAEDAGLRNAVANMVAVGFSLPPNQTHLWSFLFDQKTLVGTLLPGFECNRPAGLTPNGFLYESGPASALGLSLHSMYLMLLQNFGALSIAMLTQGGAQEVIHGGIISREVSVRHFCAENLRLLWEKLLSCVYGDNLLRLPLVTQCLQRLLKMIHTEKMHLDMKFMDSGLVYAYEKLWHSQIYSEGRSHLELKYQEQCPLSQEEFFVSLRDIDDHCLHFPTLTTMKHDLVEHVGIDSGGPQVLLMFVNVYQRLSVGSALLPHLVKMYNWLNTHLAHLLTHQQAMEKTVDEIFHLASEHFSDGDLVWTHYETMKVQFNKFVDLYGGYVCHEDTVIGKIDDSTKIVQLLTEGSKNDWLCVTMDTIVALHNSLIEMVKKAENREFHSWLSKVKQDVYDVSQFKQNMAILWENDNFDQELASLFYGRCSCRIKSAQSMVRKYEWDELECDVVRQYVVGKPQLSDVNRRPFRFRTDPTEKRGERSNGVTSPGHPVDLAALRQELHEYKLKELSSLCQEDKSLLESTFHNLDYTNLSKLVQSLRNAAGWLHERLLEDEDSIHNETLRILFTSEQLNETIGTSSLQESILMGFQVTQVHEILEIFVEWIDSCYYSFSELPYTLKQPLSDEQKEWTRNVLQESASHDMPMTLGLVRELENSLTHIIQTGINYLLQQSLTSNLRDYVQICQLLDNDYLRIIHSRVQLQHIVHFIILLRSEKNKLENGPALVAAASSKEWHDKIDLSLPNFDPSAVDFTLSQQQTHRTHSSSLSAVNIWVDHKTHVLPTKPHPYDPVSEVVKSWTVEQVSKWLKDIGLEKYVKRFEEEEIDGAQLAYIDKDCLEELGVNSALHRNKIISKLRKIPN